MGITMKFDSKIYYRKSICLKGYDYSQAGGYFVTIVSYGRELLFGEVVSGEMRVNTLGKIVQECWGKIPVHFPNVEMDAFVVMPNHVHGIIFIHENNRAAMNLLPSVGARHILPERYVSPLRCSRSGGLSPSYHPGVLTGHSPDVFSGNYSFLRNE